MTESNADDSRHHGVELGELHHRLTTHSYPTTTGELIDAYGDLEIQLENGAQSFEEVIWPYPSVSFPTADAVRIAVFTLVDEQAVGRKGYSDRDPPVPGERAGHSPVSF